MSAPEVVQLRKEDCEVARTAEELIAWIESLDARIDALSVPKTYTWMENDLPKHFFEEIRPLGHLAHHKYRWKPNFYLRPKIGNQDYDAEIIDTSSGDEHMARVEFVSTHRDHDLALREEYLGQHGNVYMTGPVWRDGTKASGGPVHVIPEFMDHQGRLDELVATIEARVAEKLGKTYAAGTILAVVFDDSFLNHEQDLSQLQRYFRDTLSKQALGKFCGLFILGVSGRTFWEFGETDSPHSC